ncbi:MAG: hypothetical protein O0V67_07250 [Methanocorpusculum sp.]|nr:hypothetical protein [Methanocorpusculum sp.]
MATKQKDTVKQEDLFTKEQLLASNKYANRRDALDAILDDGGAYTFEQVDALLEKFMKGKVN